jgi:hypothetical protein
MARANAKETSYGAKRPEATKMPLERGMPLTGGMLCGCESWPCPHENGRPMPAPPNSGGR